MASEQVAAVGPMASSKGAEGAAFKAKSAVLPTAPDGGADEQAPPLVRAMTAVDLDAVASLEAFSPDPWTRAQLAEELAAPFAHCLVLCGMTQAAGATAGPGAAVVAGQGGGTAAPAAQAASPPQAASAVLGFCTAQLAADEATLNAITVAPACRGQGYGLQLLTALEACLRARGATTLYLEVRSRNAPALALYQKAGYTVTGRRPRFYRAPPDDAITMKKQLGDKATEWP